MPIGKAIRFTTAFLVSPTMDACLAWINEN